MDRRLNSTRNPSAYRSGLPGRPRASITLFGLLEIGEPKLAKRDVEGLEDKGQKNADEGGISSSDRVA